MEEELFSRKSQCQTDELRFETLENGRESTGPRVNNAEMCHAVVGSLISSDDKNLLVEVWAVA